MLETTGPSSGKKDPDVERQNKDLAEALEKNAN